MSASSLRFDYKTLTLGRRITDQQLWCLGCDVREKSFPLRELGWTYHSRPDKSRGCGRLSGTLPNEGHLSLWGFGFLASDATHGALWLGRKNFRPEWASGFDPNRAVFEQKQLPPFEAPQTDDQVDCVLALLAELSLRLAEHEEDVLALLGEDYRTQCLADWKFRKRAFDPAEVPDTWRRIHREVRALRRSISSADVAS